MTQTLSSPSTRASTRPSDTQPNMKVTKPTYNTELAIENTIYLIQALNDAGGNGQNILMDHKNLLTSLAQNNIRITAVYEGE